MKINLKNKLFEYIYVIKNKVHSKKEPQYSIDNKNDVKSKFKFSSDKIKAILLLILVFIGAVLFTYTSLTEKKENVDLNAGIQVTKASNKNANISQSKYSLNKINLTGIENPFVLLDSYQNIDDMSESAQARLSNNTVKTHNQNLPLIPNYENRSFSKLPPIPNTQTPSTPTQQIQGIMSDEQGNKVAIIDGQVVKAGDNINGNTISSISNKGIAFTNGNKISYNIAN